jgi:hypothetical protein
MMLRAPKKLANVMSWKESNILEQFAETAVAET